MLLHNLKAQKYLGAVIRYVELSFCNFQSGLYEVPKFSSTTTPTKEKKKTDKPQFSVEVWPSQMREPPPDEKNTSQGSH